MSQPDTSNIEVPRAHTLALMIAGELWKLPGTIAQVTGVSADTSRIYVQSQDRDTIHTFQIDVRQSSR